MQSPQSPANSSLKIDRYKFGTVLGEGAYARVIHVRHRDTGVDYALKVLNKKLVIKERKKKFVVMEKSVLCRLSHPGIVKLYFTFQDSKNLYFGMNLIPGGEFGEHIRWKQEQNAKSGVTGACSIKDTQFYMTELLLVLEYLHSNGIVHRDLKPENMLLTADGHIVVNDFGTAKDDKINAKCTTFCGTACYVSPEVLNSSPASAGTDLWAFGCIIYQALTGKLCFQGGNEFLTFELISQHPATRAFEFPEYVPAAARDLIDSLLKQKPEERLGGGAEGSDNDYKKLKAHTFFKEFSFDTIRETKAPAMAPIKPLEEPMFDSIEQIDLDPMFSLVSMDAVTPPSPPITSADATSNNDTSADSTSSSADTSSANDGTCVTADPTPKTTHSDVGTASASTSTIGPRRASVGDDPKSWRMFLVEGEQVVMSGLVYRRGFWRKQRRTLLVTDSPRLISIDNETDTLKCIIPLSAVNQVVLKTGSRFNIVTKRCTFNFEDCSDNARRWADAIDKQLHGSVVL